MREPDLSMSAAAVSAESCEGQRPSLLLHAAEVAPGGNRRRTAARLVAACALLLLVVVCGNIMRPHGFFIFGLHPAPFSHIFHNLEGRSVFKTVPDQIQHDAIPRSDNFGNIAYPAFNQVLRVAEPDI